MAHPDLARTGVPHFTRFIAQDLRAAGFVKANNMSHGIFLWIFPGYRMESRGSDYQEAYANGKSELYFWRHIFDISCHDS
ncbi:hypothetical protein GCM10027419_53670 [Pandoraea terrae]